MFLFVQLFLAVEEHLSAFGHLAHHLGHNALTFMVFHVVQHRREEIVVRRENLVYHARLQHCVVEQFPSVYQVYHADAGHHGGAVDHGETVSEVQFQRFKSLFGKHFGGGVPFVFVENFAFAYEAEGYVRKLHEVAAGANTSVFGYVGVDAAVDEVEQLLHHVDVDSGMTFDKGAVACYHGAFHLYGAEGVARAGGVGAYYVVLQVVKLVVGNTVLGHGTETGVDAVDDFVLSEIGQKSVTLFNLAALFVGKFQGFAFQKQTFYIFEIHTIYIICDFISKLQIYVFIAKKRNVFLKLLL